MHVDSREYQARLEPRLLARGDTDVFQLFAFLSRLDPSVVLLTRGWRSVFYVRELFDPPEEDFARRHAKLRVRSYEDRVDFTFKAVSPDRYAAAEASVDAIDKGARVKLEEGIYAFHSTYSRQATVRRPRGSRCERVRDWARLFPGAAHVADADAPTLATSRSVVRRIKGLELVFGKRVVPAMVDIAFADESRAVPQK